MRTVIPVVIPLFNGVEFTKKCYESIKSRTKPTGLQPFIIFVNNGSTDDTLKYIGGLEFIDKNVKAIHSKTNEGFAKAVNKGLRWALENFKAEETPTLAILNNDTLVTDNWLEELTICLMHRPDVALAGPVSNFVAGRQVIDRCPATPEDYNDYAKKLKQSYGSQFYEVGRIMGLCWLMRREVAEKVGLLDESFPVGMYEDNDYCLRCALAGYKIFFTSGCFIYHFGSRTIGSMYDHKGFTDRLETNRKIFFEKYKMDRDPKIVSICRVKNGLPWIVEAVEKVLQFSDKVLILDDHSTDGFETKLPQDVRVFIRKSGDNTFDEARDRDLIVQWAKEYNPDWIYCFDADEIPEDKLCRDIKNLIKNGSPETFGYTFMICHFWNDDKHIRTDGLWGHFWQCRLFKNVTGQRIKGDDEGLHSGSTPFIPLENLRTAFYRIKHYGNQDPEGRKKKYEWYTKTDTKKDPRAILGAWEGFYKKKYGYQQDIPLKDEDFYKHIVDEKDMVLAEWKEANTISASMIVKSDEPMLLKALQSVADLVEEAILAVTDGKKVDIEAEGVKHFDFKWCDDFSAARNFAKEKSTGQWILRIDADEIVPEPAKITIFEQMQTPVDAIMFPISNVQKDKSVVISETIRVFRNIPEFYYTCRVHEDIADSLEALGKKRAVQVVRSPYEMVHFGYLQRPEEEKSNKFEYYAKLAELDMKDKPNDYRAYFNLAVQYYHSGDIQKATELYEKVIQLNPNMWMAWNDLAVCNLQSAIDKEKLDKTINFLRMSYMAAVKLNAHKAQIEKIERNIKVLSEVRRVAGVYDGASVPEQRSNNKPA